MGIGFAVLYSLVARAWTAKAAARGAGSGAESLSLIPA